MFEDEETTESIISKRIYWFFNMMLFGLILLCSYKNYKFRKNQEEIYKVFLDNFRLNVPAENSVSIDTANNLPSIHSQI